MRGGEPDDAKLHRLWLTLTYIHARSLAEGLPGRIGMRVFSGPFKGLELTPAALMGAFGPVLLGTYEHELHPYVEQAIARNYPQILNIGCAYGYYSVGLALRMPGTVVHAFDIDEAAQQKCREMSALNGVDARVRIGGEFRGEDFASYAGRNTLVVMDIEGAETQLLDPVRYPALAQMDVIVELHDLFDPSISRAIRERFAPTHEVAIVRNRPLLFDFAPVIGEGAYVDPFDNLIVTWENRAGPTPWAVMRRKAS